MPTQQKMTFDVRSEWLNHEVSVAFCKDAKIDLDTNLAGNPNAFNPAELLLAALSACMIKGIERVAPMLKLSFLALTLNCMACGKMFRRKWNRSLTKSS